MTSTQPIVFYDIPANTELIPSKAWSPNMWKVRYALNYKGIPYRTEWIEYPDIKEAHKKAGIPPSRLLPDGTEYYSCPAIIDPSTGACISESAKIIKYLDDQYPDTPRLFPDGTLGLQSMFYDVFEAKIFSIFPMLIPTCIDKMNPQSQPYLHFTREKFFGKSLKELYPVGEALVQAWAKVKEEFGSVDAWYEKGKTEGPYLTGSKPGFADFVIAAWVLSIKLIFGEESEEWKDVTTWHNGRWAALVDGFEKYQIVKE